MMTRLIRLSLLCAAFATLAGCSTGNNFISFPGVYKMDIQQGNVITQKEVDQLKPGMTKDQVAFIISQPVLSDIFDKNRWDYVYSFQPGGKKRMQKTLSLFFKQGKLSGIKGDLLPNNKKASM